MNVQANPVTRRRIQLAVARTQDALRSAERICRELNNPTTGRDVAPQRDNAGWALIHLAGAEKRLQALLVEVTPTPAGPLPPLEA